MRHGKYMDGGYMLNKEVEKRKAQKSAQGVEYKTITTPTGQLIAIFDEHYLYQLLWKEEWKKRVSKNEQKLEYVESDASKMAEYITKEINDYFQSKHSYQFSLQIKPRGTEFQKKVWREVQKIEYGTTAAY